MRRPIDNGVHRSEQCAPGFIVEHDDDARGGEFAREDAITASEKEKRNSIVKAIYTKTI